MQETQMTAREKALKNKVPYHKAVKRYERHCPICDEPLRTNWPESDLTCGNHTYKFDHDTCEYKLEEST